MAIRERSCEYCGEPMGLVDWSASDGPLTCGKPECERWARDEIRAMNEQAAYEAEQDGYGRYGGGW